MHSECIFCHRASFAERIIAENDERYVIASLGQITDGGYVLVIPKRHVSCMGALTSAQLTPMLFTQYKLGFALEEVYSRSVTVFEHGIVGQTINHAHLHILPAMVDLGPKIRADFPNAEIEELPAMAHLPNRYRRQPRPYLLWSAPDGTAMICWDPPATPQYLRLKTAELLGRPERSNWKTMDAKLDKLLWQSTVTLLKPYFE